MANFELDDEEQAMVFDALKGDVNEQTLTKTRKLLTQQKLYSGVAEVDRHLFVLKGDAKGRPGLLRKFDPQRDALANMPIQTMPESGNLFEPVPDGDAAGTAPTAGDGGALEWSEEVPVPRPAMGDAIALPPGVIDGARASVTVVDVLGYSPERGAFRVVDSVGVDGLIFWHPEAEEFRILEAAMQYPDAEDEEDDEEDRTASLGDDLADPRDEQDLAEGLVPAGATDPDEARAQYPAEPEEPANIGGQPSDD